jgi:putative hemolysin
LNDFLKDCEGLEGFEFVDKVLDGLNLSYRVVGREIERIPSEGPVLMLVNRPLGLSDCAALAKLVGEVRRDLRIVANEALSAVPALRGLLVPPQAAVTALESGALVIASRPLSFAPAQNVLLLPVSIGPRPWAPFHGLAAWLRRGAILPIRIAESRTGKGKLIGFKSQTPIARPEDRLALRRELQRAQILGHTADGKQIVLVDAAADSAVLRELGRLREIAFRQVGEGTGKRRDIDLFDTYYRHVVLWDDAELQIAGAYRIGEAGRVVKERGLDGLYTHRLFAYGDALRTCLPEALELGRSFVQPRYQGLRALDLLWQGIGAYLLARPHVRYLFGPASLSAAYPEAARRMIVAFFARYYGGGDAYAAARLPFELAADDFCPKDLRTLKEALAEMGVAIPVLYKQYAELCEPGGTRFLAFSVDPAFSNCIDALVLVDLHRLKAAKRERYLGSVGKPAEAPAALVKSA